MFGQMELLCHGKMPEHSGLRLMEYGTTYYRFLSPSLTEPFRIREFCVVNTSIEVVIIGVSVNAL